MNKPQKRRHFESNQTDGIIKQVKTGESSSSNGLVFNHNFTKNEEISEKYEESAQISHNMAVSLIGKSVNIFRFQRKDGIITASKYQFTVPISSVDSLIDGLKAMKNYYQQNIKKN